MPNPNIKDYLFDNLTLHVSKYLSFKGVQANDKILKLDGVLNKSPNNDKPLIKLSLISVKGKFIQVFIDFDTFKKQIESGLKLLPDSQSLTIDFASMHSPFCDYYFNYTDYKGWKDAPEKGWRDNLKKNEYSPLLAQTELEDSLRNFTTQESSQIQEKNIAFIRKPLNWNNEIYCYAYSKNDSSVYNANWPGIKMAASPDLSIYSLKINIPNPLIVFTDGIHQYPNQAQNGYELKGSMILCDGEWTTYKKDNRRQSQINKRELESFRLAENVTKVSDHPVKIHHIPVENDILMSKKNGQVKLVKRLGGGGEGDVYRTNTPYIAKIYKQGKLTQRNQKKLELMISKDIVYEGICYPVDLLYGNNEFVGYLMPEAKGDVLQTSVFQPMVMKESYPDWKKKDLVDLALNILNKIKYLHDRNIILGDINPQNILIVSPNEVYFVDSDSYQIEEFPCPVGTIYFTAPELQGKEFKTYLRTFGNENFAIATLLFMLMLPGKAPYAHVGGGSPMDNIKAMHFPYPFKGFPEDTPPGFWRFCWSHLPYKLKDAFYKTFMKDESYSEEISRLGVNEWINLFTEYQFLLESGRLQEQDEMANDIFPTRLKRNSKYTYIKCRICSEEYPDHKLKEGICYSCLNSSYKNKQYFCEKCGNEISFTNFDYYVKGYKKPLTKCRDCFDSENQVYRRIRCIDCGNIFDFTNRDHDFYVSKGWQEPNRCKHCRDKKKNS